ncbi:PrsW family intramembrane metalloprotease [Glaciihabitans sp. INWT7]|uniref:PrsW family intramembrane metalloprotease n=1 Tax=Glaciihabitans sp. INWT7 TaxID=2596912 RepID=UPI001624FA95|nr:PrsW family intramembrane metalloprotease [Glaciihabitans sp. INWT7]QNE46497.1 PrsW family intramembrane metalloprotease [Glaciihabitans sp. INWT7]
MTDPVFEAAPSIARNADPVVAQEGDRAVTTPVRRKGSIIALAALGFAVLTLVMLLVAWYLLAVLGPTALLVALVLAAIPLVGVLFFIHWIDRWEPEPRGALLFALLWGAGASVLIALVFSGVTQHYESLAGLTGSGVATFFETVVQAPVIEEFAKGLGILLILWVMRRTFDGPVDGVVYAATIAIGFAFTENLQYFGLAINQDGGLGTDVAQTFLLRAILSPFAHVMFTACTGVLLGLAARRTGRLGAIGYFLLGLVPAVLLHAFWNSASYWATDWFRYYFVVQVPLFVLAIAGITRLRRHEQRLTHVRLSEYAAVGWFTESEVNLLTTGAGRQRAITWATRQGLGRPYRRFVRDATRLAFARERLVNGREGIGASLDEAALLEAIGQDRRALAALPPLQ